MGARSRIAFQIPMIYIQSREMQILSTKFEILNKREALNPKFTTSTQGGGVGGEKRYDLEDRTLMFAREVSRFLEGIPKTIGNLEYCKQLLRSSGSVGANYIEANESLGRKDFLMRIRICRKEAKESRYWLELLSDAGGEQDVRDHLIRESIELMKIFGAIIQKSL